MAITRATAVRLRTSTRVPVSTQLTPAITSIEVVSGDATLLSFAQVCSQSCVQISERIMECTTTCTAVDTNRRVSITRPTNLIRTDSDPTEAPTLDFFGMSYIFNLDVIGTHKISSAYAVGHAEGYRHRQPAVRFYFPGF